MWGVGTSTGRFLADRGAKIKHLKIKYHGSAMFKTVARAE